MELTELRNRLEMITNAHFNKDRMNRIKTITWKQLKGSSQGRSQHRRSEGAPAFGDWRVGTEVGANKCLIPSCRGVRGTEIFFCIFLIQSPAFGCITWLRKWALPVFLSRPLYIGGNKDCWKRLPNEARRVENRGWRRHRPCICWRGDSNPHQLGGLAVM